uniref:Uncharacterized protein n=1 Tax=Mycena chlorophos TaxID=658473 RepID=A0ABQ0LE46_MYCCL|nr:predicted protein [Mycena chlorophos]
MPDTPATQSHLQSYLDTTIYQRYGAIIAVLDIARTLHDSDQWDKRLLAARALCCVVILLAPRAFPRSSSGKWGLWGKVTQWSYGALRLALSFYCSPFQPGQLLWQVLAFDLIMFMFGVTAGWIHDAEVIHRHSDSDPAVETPQEDALGRRRRLFGPRTILHLNRADGALDRTAMAARRLRSRVGAIGYNH